MDIVQTFDPDRNSDFTKEELNAMKQLTFKDVELLAKHYPNRPLGNTYLVLWDDNEAAHQQRYPLSTWQNLLALWRLGQTQYKPHSFRSVMRRSAVMVPKPIASARKTRVVDLSDADMDTLEGLKKQEDEKSEKPKKAAPKKASKKAAPKKAAPKKAARKRAAKKGTQENKK